MIVAASTGRENFVDVDVSVLAWVALGGVIVALLAFDLFQHREAHAPSRREALVESSLWVAVGVSFGLVIAWVYGSEAFGEYISGYLIEKSLSIDNVFVWSILFSTLAIPVKYQHRVLFWGVFGALALRGGFIALGSALISQFVWVLAVFGAFLIYTGFRVIRHRDDEGEGVTWGTGLVRRFLPVSAEYDGQRFTTKIKGKRAATPLLAALVVVEITDVIFAVDSVPAILAVSNEPYLVFASNAFAILGLRAMYFLLADARTRFHYLSHGLGAILIFVGFKMTLANWYHIDTFISLGIIIAILVVAIVFSELKSRRLQPTSPV